MKVLCLGGCGRISREAVLDLVQFSDVDRITVADRDPAIGREVVAWLNDDRVDFVPVNVRNAAATVQLMRDYEIVMDGTPISVNGTSAGLIAEAGAHGINLNGMGDEWDHHDAFAAKDRAFVAGFGMTPGITNLMAMHAANQLDTVDTVRVSHGAFRPIAFSAGIAETTCYEYDPALPSRIVFEDGEFIQVPPFARPRTIELPAPYGSHPQYIIPHPETRTLADSLAGKGVRLIEVRGTWPPANMALIRALFDWGFFRNDPVEVDGTRVGIMSLIARYLNQTEEGTTTSLYGYALHVEVVGTANGKPTTHVLTHTHPASDGSVPEWAGLRAYTRCVAIPMGIAVQMMASGRVNGVGVVSPEMAFDPAAVFAELERRDIHVHHAVREGTS